MKANDLRIRNWIKYEDKLVQVVQLSSLMILCQRDENQFLVNCAPKVPFAKLINKLNGNFDGLRNEVNKLFLDDGGKRRLMESINELREMLDKFFGFEDDEPCENEK